MEKKSVFATGLVLCLFLLTSVVEGKWLERNCVVKMISGIEFDGKVDQGEWKESVPITGFTTLDAKLAKEETELYLGYDKDNLYIGFVCYQSQIDKLKAHVQKRDSLQIFDDDNMEIFLDTGYNQKYYYHLTVNSIGTRFDQVMRGLSWDGNWKVVTHKGKDYWSGEIVVPFKSLGIESPQKGDRWGVNFCRTNSSEKEIARWGVPVGSNHQPQLFGIALFGNYSADLTRRIKELRTELKKQRGKIPFMKEENKYEVRLKLDSTSKKIDLLSKNISERQITDAEWKKSDKILNNAAKGLSLIGEEYIIWSRAPSTQITPEDFPETGEIINELNISTYINEYESANFILSNTTKKTIFARVLVNELIDEKTKRIVSPKDIELRTASFIKLHSKRIIADALPRINEANLLTLPPDIPTQVWLTFKTKDISAGSYKGKISIKPLYDAPLRDIGINLRVYPLRLSDKPPLKVYMGPVMMTRYRKNLTEETYRVYAKDIAEHKATFGLWTRGDNISWGFDKTGYKGIREDQKASFEKRVRAFREQGIDILLLEVHGALYAGYLARGLSGILTPAWKEAIRKWLPDAVSYLKSLGYDYDHLYICVGHEIKGKGAEQAAQVAKFLKEVDPKIKLWVIASGSTLEDIKKLARYVDGFMIYGKTLFPPPEITKFLKSEGKIVTFYVTGGLMKPHSPFGVYRKMGWNAWFHGVDGMNLWTYDYFYLDSWMEEPLGKHKYVDASVIYIDSNWPKEPVTSRRWEMFREGIEDYCHLHMLKKTVEKAKDEGIDTLKAEVLLNRFSEEVYRSRDAEDEIYPYTKEVAEETIRLNAEMSFKITSPEVKIKENDVIIQWETTEPAKGKIYYRKVIEGYGAKSFAQVWLSVDENSFSNKHSVCLTNLDLTNEYIFYTLSSNEIGYVVEDDNAGKYYTLGKR